MTRFLPRRGVLLLCSLLVVVVASTFTVFLAPAPARADYTASNLPDWAIGPFHALDEQPDSDPAGNRL